MSTALATRAPLTSLDLLDANALSGRQKAAILCLSLGTDMAAAITQKLQPDEIDAISFEIARMESVSPAVVDAVLEEWMTRIMVADSLAQGGSEAAREILDKAFGPRKAAQILERINGQLQNTIGLHRLRNADAQRLGQMLAGEHPQTIAVILAHLEPQQTAAILKEVDTTIGAEVVYRMAKMEKVQPELIMLIERSLSADTDLTSTTGENFWRGNNERATGGVLDPTGRSLSNLNPKNPVFPPAVKAVLVSGTEVDRQRVFMAEALRFIKDRPLDAARLFAGKMRSFWWKIVSNPGDYDPAAARLYEWIYRTELALALVGVASLFRKRPPAPARADRSTPAFLVALMMGISLVQSVFYVQGRHRFLIEPLLLIFTAWGTLATGSALRSRVDRAVAD